MFVHHTVHGIHLFYKVNEYSFDTMNSSSTDVHVGTYYYCCGSIRDLKLLSYTDTYRHFCSLYTFLLPFRTTSKHVLSLIYDLLLLLLLYAVVFIFVTHHWYFLPFVFISLLLWWLLDDSFAYLLLPYHSYTFGVKPELDLCGEPPHGAHSALPYAGRAPAAEDALYLPSRSSQSMPAEYMIVYVFILIWLVPAIA